MERPAHSPDLAPSDFHLFGPFKEALGGRRFQRDDVKNAVHQWPCAQPKTFYYDGIKKLIGRWEKCVEKQGDYIEK
jgi:histone-lysine N-methyltransferase SETMAR